MSTSGWLPALALFALIVLSTGCTSLALGDVYYRNQSLLVHVSNNGDPVDAGIQVRIYEIKNLNQRELTVIGTPVSVLRGENEFIIPVALKPGTYKLRMYLTINSERKTAGIKDIMV